MGENNDLTTGIIVVGVGVLGYFLFKDKLSAFFDRLGNATEQGFSDATDTIINIGGNTGILPAGVAPMIKTLDIVRNDDLNIMPYVKNVAASVREGTKGKVKEVTGGTGTYKASTGTLTVDGQGYSVAAEKAPAMAKQVYIPPSSNVKTIQTVYSKINVNPYSKIK